jgi:hypothetical protein
MFLTAQPIASHEFLVMVWYMPHMRQSTPLFREFGVLSIRVDFGWISTNVE